MPLFGIAILLVCAVSLADRKEGSPFYAFAVLAGWLLGFGPPQIWPFISLALGLWFALVIWKTNSKALWSWAVASCSCVALLADAGFWLLYAQGVYIWDSYLNVLDGLLALSLAFLAYPGGRKLVGLGRAWLGSLRSWERARLGMGTVKTRSAHWSGRYWPLDRVWIDGDDGISELQGGYRASHGASGGDLHVSTEEA